MVSLRKSVATAVVVSGYARFVNEPVQRATSSMVFAEDARTSLLWRLALCAQDVQRVSARRATRFSSDGDAIRRINQPGKR